MSSATTQKRKPRYRRVPSVGFRLQERDRDIIQEVFKHRFLNSNHIAALIGGSRQPILRRLHGLFHAGYLARPLEQIRPYQRGSDPMVYGLGNAGADLLAEEYQLPRGKIDWTRKNRGVGARYLEHALLVSHFMVCLELACRARKNVELIRPEEIFNTLPEGSQKKQNPFGWKVNLKYPFDGKMRSLTMGVIPDNIFGLYFPNDPPGRNKAYFFLEADRATMPVKRNNPYKTSFFKKMLGYWASYQQDLFKENLGFKAARVLTLTKSQDRIDNMIAANKEVDERGNGSKMFLFASEDQVDLSQPEMLLESIWRNGRDETLVSLMH